MKCVFPYLSCASDRLRQISLAAGPIRSTFQIWQLTRNISMQFLRSFLGRRFAGKPVEDSEITDDFSGYLARGISWLNPWATSPTYPGCRYDGIIFKKTFLTLRLSSLQGPSKDWWDGFQGSKRRLTKSVANTPFPHYTPVSKHKEMMSRLGWTISVQITVYCPPELQVGAFVHINAETVWKRNHGHFLLH